MINVLQQCGWLDPAHRVWIFLSKATLGMHAEYSRTFMRIACHYLEGKDIHPITPSELRLGIATADASSSDASSTTQEHSEEVQSEGPDRV
jgi:hypothetical protein